MAHIISRKHAARPLPSRLTHTTAALALMAPALALAQQAEPNSALPAVKVKAAVENDYKAERSSSTKVTQPLVDTPQTITVIKKELLLEQGATTLSEALRNTPGITFQMGENGNTQTGDAIFMRGFDTQNSIFVDGIRDIGTFSRDVFNLEQVEVVKGPVGADIGRGAPTGYINLSTKLPTLVDANSGTVTLGMAETKRGTLDINRALPFLGDGTAARLNLMYEDRGVVDRDHVEKNSWGFAPSVAFGLNSPTRTYLYYLHLEQDNVPDGGISAIGMDGWAFSAAQQTTFTNAGLPVPTPARVDRSNFYGSTSDYDRVKADMFTARVEHDLKPGVTIRNVSRFGRTEQRYVLTGINAVAISGGTVNPADPSTWTVGRSRQGKDQENQILTNQTSVNADFATGELKHSLVSGVEFIYEKQTNLTQGAVAGQVTDPANLYNPDPNGRFADVRSTGARTAGSTVTAALYAFDTLKLTESWLLNGGVRWEKYKTTTDAITLSTAAANPTLPVGTPLGSNLTKGDDLLTWKVGAVWKPTENGSVYVAYSTAEKPPGSENFTLNASATNINNPNMDPSKASNLEVGTKWELLDKRLAVTAAVYKAVTKNDLVSDVDPVTGVATPIGKKTVEGIELAAAGMLTPAWQLSAGIAFMDTTINETNNVNQQGQSLSWSPKTAFTSWTTYRLPFGLTIGGGARYQDSALRSSNAVVTGVSNIPSYWVFDAMATYEVTKNLSLQLNVYNVADKFYVQSLNSGGSRYTLGAPRSANLTANIRF